MLDSVTPAYGCYGTELFRRACFSTTTILVLTSCISSEGGHR